MQGKNITRRRGTSIAAAALSLALVAPAVQPVVAPQFGAVANAQTSGTVAATPATDPSKLIEADGIANGYVTKRIDMTNAFATLSGVIGLKETSASSSLKGTMGINDATVYLQFKDVDGTISPIYTAKSHQLGNTAGNYAFDLRAKDEEGNLLSHPDSPVPGGEYSFVDANGKPHIFRAKRGQEYRIWVDSPLKNEETGNDLGYVRQAGGGVPGAWAPVTQGTANGAFYLEGNNMQRTGVFLEERAPSVSENSYMVSPKFSMDEEGWHKPSGTEAPRYSYFGRVWSDAEGGPDRNEVGPLYFWKGDQPIEGAKVYASVLSDEGIAEFERLAIADKPYREQAAATKAMIENMRANGKEPILKTVGAETNADGRYTIRMGDDIGRRMKDYTYIWAEKDGKVLNSFSGFPTPVFQSVNANSGENPNSDGAVGIASFTNHRWYNINFAEVQADITHLDIVNYDSFLNPADLPEGINNLEPAKVKLTGALPFSGDNKIRWIGPDGKQIGEDCPVNTLADAKNCDLAPADFAEPGTYVAQLVNAYGVVIAQDSFIAVDKVRQNGEFEPQYKDAEAKVGETTTVAAPQDKDGKDLPEGTSFKQVTQVTDPNGKQIDTPNWVTVDPDGKIKLTPPEDAEAGEYNIPVLVTYPDGSRETITAKVTVKKEEAAPTKTTVDDSNVKPVDPTEDKQGTGIIVNNPDKDTKVSAKDEDGKDIPVVINPDTGEIEVTPGKDVDGPINVVVEDPDLTDGKVKVEVPVNGHEKDRDDNNSDKTPGNPSVNTTPETVIEGKPIKPFDTAKDVPEGGKVEVENLPGGLKVNPETGEVTGTPDKITDWGKEEEKRDVEVTVVIKDKDDNKVAEGKKVITIQRDTDGDGTPDITDTDDDGDGVSDEDEKNAGTDPKDPNSVPPSIIPGKSTDQVPANGEPKTLDDKVKNPTEGMTGDVLDKDGNPIENAKVEVDPNTGEIKVTVPEGTDPQDGKVVIRDKNSNPVGEIDIKIVDPKSDAAKNTPNYGDRKDVEAGETESSDPFEGKTDVPVKDAKGKPSAGSGDWTFKTGETDGVVEATAPGYDKVAEKIKSELPNIDSSWDKFKEIFTPYVRPSVDVDFTYNDGSENFATADFDLVGKDGKSLLDPNGDFDGDGISNKDEIEKGSNPADEESTPDEAAPTVDPVKPGDKKITGKDDRPNTEITVTFPDGTKKKVTTDKDGNWSVDVPEGTDLNHGDKIKVTDEAGNETPVEVKDTDKPTINEIKPGDKTISGKGDRPGEDIKVTLPNGKVIETTTDENGNWSVDVPSDVDLKTGDTITVTDAAGNKATAKVGIDTGKCVATTLGFGLPLIALLPIGLATQMDIPGVTPIANEVSARLEQANSQIQQQLGIFNPQMAGQVAEINARLKEVGGDLSMVAAGIALIAAGILAGTLIYDNCSPNGGFNSSVKDLELKGSSGKTHELSSKKQGEDKKPSAQK